MYTAVAIATQGFAWASDFFNLLGPRAQHLQAAAVDLLLPGVVGRAGQFNLERVARAAETLASDEEDERAVETIMQVYTDLAETSFRMFGWLALGAESVVSGNDPTPELQPPMLGEMQQRLEAGGPLARLLARRGPESHKLPRGHDAAIGSYPYVRHTLSK